MEKRLRKGLIVGLIGGVIMNIPSLINYHILHISRVRFLDWALVMLYGHKPINIAEAVFAQIAQLGFCAVLGAIFAYLVVLDKDMSYWLRDGCSGHLVGSLFTALIS